MTTIKVSVPHALPQEEALRRVKGFIAQAKEQFAGKGSEMKGDITEKWTGNTGAFEFTTQGTTIAGTIEVEEEKVELTTKLPMAAMLFKGKIESALKDGLSALLK